MTSKVVVVDGNAIGYQYHNGTVLTVGGVQIQAIFGFLRGMYVLKRKYRGWKIIVVWDGRAQWRFDLYPDYKSNRAKDAKSIERKEKYKKQVPIIQKMIEYIGIEQMTVTSAEADDVAGFMAQRFGGEGKQLILITGDGDWIQLLREGVIWHDPIRDYTVSMGNLFEFTGYTTPRAYLDGKALQGDSSDFIEPTGGIGEKGAPLLLAEFGSVDEFFKRVEEGTFIPKKKAHEKLVSNKERFLRNRTLMNLIDFRPFLKEDIRITRGKLNKKGLRDICERLAFKSLLVNFDENFKIFQEN
jgi:DNA polymerase I